MFWYSPKLNFKLLNFVEGTVKNCANVADSVLLPGSSPGSAKI